jgi:group II intron reverse transcriptase/maturase
MKKRKWYSLYDKVYSLVNLEQAWEKVRSNRGAGGVDRQSIEVFEANRDRNLAELQRLLREKRYRPLPLRRVYIPKSNGERRPLGIPAIRDRVVQQALLTILEPIFEPLFHDRSYGFRPGRSAHQAIQRVRDSLAKGKEWVIDVDIRKYFDTVNHELLLEKVNEEISDGSVLKLIRMFLEAGVLEEGVYISTETGTPQGGVISPLLANLYLNGLDWQMDAAGYEVVRYADDLVVLCSSQAEAKEAWERLQQIFEDALKLQIHSEKSRILCHRTDSFEFLGFLIHWRYLWPRIRTIQRFKEQVRILTRRQQPRNLLEVINRVNYTLRGFGNYYRMADVKGLFAELDGWVRMRLRCYHEKKKAVKHQNYRIPNAYLKSFGLVSLSELKMKYLSLLPAMGQPYKKAVYGKTVRTV